MTRKTTQRPERKDKPESPKKLFARLKEDDVKFVSLQFTDIMGHVKSLNIPVEKLKDSLKNGTWFDGSSIEGFARIHESDMLLRPDIPTYAMIPWRSHTARIICDVYDMDEKPFAGDPRGILKRVLAQAQGLGLEFKVGPELEFFLFRKHNGELSPLPHDNGGYIDFTIDKAADIRQEMVTTLQGFGIDVESDHHEVAPGQHEIDFKYMDALDAADAGITMRTVLKAIAAKHDLHATFMPKPIEGEAGSGMHVHQSLFRNGKNTFYNKKDTYFLSNMAYGFIAAQLEHIRAMSAILSPTVNSYKRLVPGYEAPVYISWARENRSALIRVPRIIK
jgi:glutamine synthetase